MAVRIHYAPVLHSQTTKPRPKGIEMETAGIQCLIGAPLCTGTSPGTDCAAAVLGQWGFALQALEPMPAAFCSAAPVCGVAPALLLARASSLKGTASPHSCPPSAPGSRSSTLLTRGHLSRAGLLSTCGQHT